MHMHALLGLTCPFFVRSLLFDGLLYTEPPEPWYIETLGGFDDGITVPERCWANMVDVDDRVCAEQESKFTIQVT